MGKLTEWIEQNAVLTQEKFNENDISTNERIRHIFFEQIEDLAFDVKEISDNTYILSLRLDFPRRTEMPYLFLFDSKKKTIVPQYTVSHRLFRTSDKDELEILNNLESYLMQNPVNKSKSNPTFARDRSTYFRSKTGRVLNDVILFDFKDTDEEIYNYTIGKFVLTYDDKVVAYQHGEKDFYIMPEYHDVMISSRYQDNVLTVYVYNITQEMKDTASHFILGVRC